MAAIGTLWNTAAQREKEAELLFIGDQYRRAIESFSQAVPPDGIKRMPKSLDELLLDPRFQHTVRHLRRAYADPITGKAEWGLIKDAQGGIAGVHSLSTSVPIKTAGFSARNAGFEVAGQYRDWAFSTLNAAAASAGTDSTSATAADSEKESPNVEKPKGSPEQGRCYTQQYAAFALCDKNKDIRNMAPYWDCRASASRVYAECLRVAQ